MIAKPGALQSIGHIALARVGCHAGLVACITLLFEGDADVKTVQTLPRARNAVEGHGRTGSVAAVPPAHLKQTKRSPEKRQKSRLGSP